MVVRTVETIRRWLLCGPIVGFAVSGREFQIRMWWTGDGWSLLPQEARLFETRQQAWRAIRASLTVPVGVAA